jgi:hypothetical protein
MKLQIFHVRVYMLSIYESSWKFPLTFPLALHCFNLCFVNVWLQRLVEILVVIAVQLDLDLRIPSVPMPLVLFRFIWNCKFSTRVYAFHESSWKFPPTVPLALHCFNLCFVNVWLLRLVEILVVIAVQLDLDLRLPYSGQMPLVLFMDNGHLSFLMPPGKITQSRSAYNLGWNSQRIESS